MTLAAVQSYSAVTLLTTAETTAISTPSVPFAPTGQTTSDPGTSGIAIRGSMNITPGAGTTSISIRCHVGSISGPHVELAPLVVAVAAGNLTQIPFEFLDSNFSNIGQGYFITAQQGAATGNGTVNEAYIELDVIAP